MPVGALALMEPIDPSEIKLGDIIAFNPVGDEETIVSHRVIEVLGAGISLEFRTQGDANEEPDYLNVPAANILARVRFNIPKLGYALATIRDYTKNRLGLMLAIFFPTVMLIGTAVRDMSFSFSSAKRRQRKLKQIRERRNRRKFHS